MKRSPYKFLDPYGTGDRDLFVGREQEIETLLGDIISSRLVVLFARTGTGKTSLINAGVRPRLEELDYRTLHLRVESDPVVVVRRALDDAGLVAPEDAGDSMAVQLRKASRGLEKPIVLFFDQFEEFFIRFRDGDQRTGGRAEDFVAHIAALYRDPDSGIHSVFSMREEYFVEMDAFRDQIPSIFGNESTLRLRPFRRSEAIRAVTAPAATLGVEVDAGLPERIVADLEQDDFIEPPQLQIVCHTLCQAGGGERLRMMDYEGLGGAAHVFSRRIEQEVSPLPDAQLALLERLIPALRTSDGTKYTRGVDELSDTLVADPKVLAELVTSLEEAHLLNELVIGRARYVEWVSDFLAERSEDVRTHARLTLHRRTLINAAEQADAKPDPSLSGLMQLMLPVARDAFARISDDVGLLELDDEIARRGLVTALVHGLPARDWLERTRREGVDVAALLRALIDDVDFPEAGGAAIRLLGELPEDPMAVSLLEEALDEPRLRPVALDALAHLGTNDAVAAVGRAGEGDPAAAAAAIDTLRRIGSPAAIAALADTVRENEAIRLRAASALKALATEPESLGRAASAREAFEAVLDEHALALLDAALDEGVQTRVWFERARDRGVVVWALLREVIAESMVGTGKGERAVALLRELPDDQATELLELARQQPHLERIAEQALQERGEPAGLRPGRPRPPSSAPPSGSSSLPDRVWTLLLERIAAGRCLPLLGPGLTAGVLPLASDIARRWAADLGLPLGDEANDLARVAQWLAVERDAMYAKESLVEEMSVAGQPPWGADEPYTVLASLPFQLYLTTGFDNFLQEALRRAGRNPVSASSASGGHRAAPASGQAVAPGVAERVVEDLMSVRVQDESGVVQTVSANHVEPVQLQVLLTSLWKTLPEDETVVTHDHTRGIDVEAALTDYCHKAIAAAASLTSISPARMAALIEKVFITPMGTRATVHAGAGQTSGLPDAALSALEDRYLLRREMRADASWLELTHDRLIEPIRHASRRLDRGG